MHCSLQSSNNQDVVYSNHAACIDDEDEYLCRSRSGGFNELGVLWLIQTKLNPH